MIQLDYNHQVQNIRINLPLYEQIVTKPIMEKKNLENIIKFSVYEQIVKNPIMKKKKKLENNIKFSVSLVTRNCLWKV